MAKEKTENTPIIDRYKLTDNARRRKYENIIGTGKEQVMIKISPELYQRVDGELFKLKDCEIYINGSKMPNNEYLEGLTFTQIKSLYRAGIIRFNRKQAKEYMEQEIAFIKSLAEDDEDY